MLERPQLDLLLNLCQLLHSPPTLHLRWHPHATIQPQYSAIQHGILNTMADQHGELLWLSLSPRELHNTLQALPHLIAHHRRHPRPKQRRRNRHNTNTIPRQVPRQWQCQRRHGALACRIRDLSRLPIKRRARAHHDQDAALAILVDWLRLNHMRQALANQINRAPHVDIHDEVEVIEVERLAIPINNLGWRADARGGDDAAELEPGLLNPGEGTLHGFRGGLGLQDVAFEEFQVVGVLSDEGLTGLLVQVENGNVAAVVDEVDDCGAAEARGANKRSVGMRDQIVCMQVKLAC